MKTDLAKIVRSLLLAALLVPIPAFAGSPTSTNGLPVIPGGQEAAPMFHGKVTAVDSTNMTVSVKKLTLHVTGDTKVTKNGLPATFSEIVVGDIIGGTYNQDDTGKRNVVTLHIGAKNISPASMTPTVMVLPGTNTNSPNTPTRTNNPPALATDPHAPPGGTNVPSAVR